MGLFDFLTGGGPEKQIIRQGKRVSNRDLQPEDREAAARWLAGDGSPQALLALLGRFDVQIENHMKDANEKEMVYQFLLEHGNACVEPCVAYVRRCKHIGYPLRLLESVGGRGPVLDAILELLDAEAAKEDFKADRKKQLLIKATEYRDARLVPSVARFLKDFDEGVRYAAVEALLVQEAEGARLPLLECMVNPAEESNRLRIRIAEAFVARKWSVEPHVADLQSNPVPGFDVSGGTLVPARA